MNIVEWYNKKDLDEGSHSDISPDGDGNWECSGFDAFKHVLVTEDGKIYMI